jgi:hypothetical protein
MSIEEELAIYKAAFLIATAGGHSFEYEGWGGRRKRGYMGPEAWRQQALESAAAELEKTKQGSQP